MRAETRRSLQLVLFTFIIYIYINAAASVGAYVPGSLYTIEEKPNSLRVLNINPSDLTVRELVSIPIKPSAIRTTLGIDAARHRLYLVAHPASSMRPAFITVDIENPSKLTFLELGLNECTDPALSGSLLLSVDISTGLVFCKGIQRQNTGPFSFDVIVGIDPESGKTYATQFPRGSLSTWAVDPLHHVVYAVVSEPSSSQTRYVLKTIDTTTFAVVTLPDFLEREDAIISNGVYDSVSDALIFLRPNGGKTVVTVLSIKDRRRRVVDISGFYKGSFTQLAFDELHQTLYLISNPGLVKVDFSSRTPIASMLSATCCPGSSALVPELGQVVFLDWDNPPSVLWYYAQDKANEKRVLWPNYQKTGKAVLADPKTFRVPVLEKVRSIYRGDPSIEMSHINIPIFEYKGKKRQNEVAEHATYVRFHLAEDDNYHRGYAWNISSVKDCTGDQFNQRLSGEVTVFANPELKGGKAVYFSDTNLVGTATAHEIGHALGLRHIWSPEVSPKEVMDYGPETTMTTKVFSSATEQVTENPVIDPKLRLPKNSTTNHIYHLRRFALGEPEDSRLVANVGRGSWDVIAENCKKVVIRVNTPSVTKSRAILSPSATGGFEGPQIINEIENTPNGFSFYLPVEASVQISESSDGGEWDHYFVPMWATTETTIPGGILQPGSFVGKIVRYSAQTREFTKVGEFSAEITTDFFDPYPGPPQAPKIKSVTPK